MFGAYALGTVVLSAQQSASPGDRVPGLFLPAFAVFLAVVNRKRGRALFFVAGGVALALCAGYVHFGSRAGYVLGLAGCAYIVIGLAKGKNKVS